jgi:hypothetical protein
MMVNRMILSAAACVLAAAVGVTTGCGKGGQAPPIDQGVIIGTWLETRPEAESRSPRLRRKEWESKNIRQVTFKNDNTFRLVVCDPSGKPLDESKAIEGTWQIEGSLVRFTVSSNTLKAPYDGWAPVAMSTPLTDQGTTRLQITHETEEATYERR